MSQTYPEISGRYNSFRQYLIPANPANISAKRAAPERDSPQISLQYIAFEIPRRSFSFVNWRNALKSNVEIETKLFQIIPHATRRLPTLSEDPQREFVKILPNTRNMCNSL